MRRKPLESLGAMVRERRGRRTLREVAGEIGIGPATLLRVESGRIPDVGTFGKICRWLKVDPGVFLSKPREMAPASPAQQAGGLTSISAHLRADQTPQPETLQALAQMLLLAARQQPRPAGAFPDEQS